MKKGMVQMQESILVTFFIIIIISLGLVLYYKFTSSSIDNYEMEYREQQLTSSLITFQGFFEYTYLGEPMNAIDTSKLFYSSPNYRFRTIIIEQAYPLNDNVRCSIENYPECNYYVVYNKTNYKLKNTLIQSMPASLYYPLSDEHRLGKLTFYSYY